MATTDAAQKLGLARDHLRRVREAGVGTPDWTVLAMFSFVCLEAAVMAAAAGVGMDVKHTHPAKVKAAAHLHADHRLPDISQLITELNDARKAVSYGDTEMPDLDADDLLAAVEEYVQAVADLLWRTGEAIQVNDDEDQHGY